MTPHPPGDGGHPPIEDIAAFIDNSLGEIETVRIRAHLATCEECLEAYEHAVRMLLPEHGASLSGVNPDALNRGKRIAEEHLRNPNLGPAAKRSRWTRMGKGGRVAVAATIVTLFAAGVLWLRPGTPPTGVDPAGAGTLKAVHSALRLASERGSVVFPGVESSFVPGKAPLRSGPVAVSTELEKSLLVLTTRAHEGRLDEEGANALIGGFIATGQFDNAHTYLAKALKRFPNDSRLVMLGALLAYYESRLGEARDALSRVVANHPDNILAAFNLAVVLSEMGSDDEARKQFERVIAQAPDGPLAERAREATDTL